MGNLWRIPISKPTITEADIDAVVEVLKSGRLTQGLEVEHFEDEFSSIVGGRICVAVNSGTSALHIALLALGIRAGDEVILPSFSFAAAANAVTLVGATPVFADVYEDTFTINLDDVIRRITKRTVAIIAVHLYGQMADVRFLNELCSRYSLVLIEDAAQAHYAFRDGLPAGGAGDVACFSFYPSKNMTTMEGGMIVVKNSIMAQMLKELRNQGMNKQYDHRRIGGNWRMTEVSAALGRSQLQRLFLWTSQRQHNAQIYSDLLPTGVFPVVAPGATHVYHQYTIKHENRDTISRRLSILGVESRIYYPVPTHRLDPFIGSIADEELPVTCQLSSTVLSVPVHPDVKLSDIHQIVSSIY